MVRPAPNALKTAQVLFCLNAAIWLAIGVESLIRVAHDGSAHQATALIIAVMMFGNVSALILSGWGIGRGGKRFYFLAVAVLIVNIVLTVTDQFGLLDLLTLIIDFILLGILLAARKWL